MNCVAVERAFQACPEEASSKMSDLVGNPLTNSAGQCYRIKHPFVDIFLIVDIVEKNLFFLYD